MRRLLDKRNNFALRKRPSHSSVYKAAIKRLLMDAHRASGQQLGYKVMSRQARLTIFERQGDTFQVKITQFLLLTSKL